MDESVTRRRDDIGAFILLIWMRSWSADVEGIADGAACYRRLGVGELGEGVCLALDWGGFTREGREEERVGVDGRMEWISHAFYDRRFQIQSLLTVHVVFSERFVCGNFRVVDKDGI